MATPGAAPTVKYRKDYKPTDYKLGQVRPRTFIIFATIKLHKSMRCVRRALAGLHPRAGPCPSHTD